MTSRPPRRPSTQPARKQAAAAPAPSLGMSWVDLLIGLWRVKGLMFLVFIMVLGLGLVVAKNLPEEYVAYSRIRVSLADDVIYESLRKKDNQPGFAPGMDYLVNAELGFLNNQELAEQLSEKMGLAVLVPKEYKKFKNATNAEKRSLNHAKAVAEVHKRIKTSSRLKNPVITVTFKHKNPQIAADAINNYVQIYLNYRRTVLLNQRSNALGEQKMQFIARLNAKNDELRHFLRKNNITNIDSEMAALTTIFQTVSQNLYDVSAQYEQSAAQLQRFNQSMVNVTPEVYTSVTTNYNQTLVDLYVQRENLLARYTPTSQRVQELNQRIAQVENLANTTDVTGTRVMGRNRLYDNLETQRVRLETEVSALAARRNALVAHKADIEQRQRHLRDIKPAHDQIRRERDVLEANVEDFLTREEQEKAIQKLIEQNVDAVSIIEKARPPTKPKSLMLIAAAASVVLAGFLALVAGLYKALSGPMALSTSSSAKHMKSPALGTTRKR